MAVRLGLTLLSAALSACTSDETVLQISGVDGAALESFVVVLTDTHGNSRSIACGTRDSAPECQLGGVRISKERPLRYVAVKAEGYGFQRQEISQGDEPVHFSLKKLPAFESTEDYATGFDAKSGQANFERLALQQDSELGPQLLVKFIVDESTTPSTVYFQNTRRYQLHYQFARTVLGYSSGPSDFSEQTYQGKSRSYYAGTVVFRPSLEAESAARKARVKAPISVVFFPSDDLPADQALRIHRLIEERLGFSELSGGTMRVAYEPAGETQELALKEAEDAFASWGSLWLTASELYRKTDAQYLNPGVAYGTLRFTGEADLSKMVLSRRDLLVLGRLPIELPLVGGTISEEFQTALSHVNIAARGRGTPNMALRDARKDPRIAPFEGKLVRLEVSSSGFQLSPATAAEAEKFYKAHRPEPFVPVFDESEERLLSFSELAFTDSRRVGVKAANLAELHQLLPDNAPAGFAVPFSWYSEFLQENQASEDLCREVKPDCIEGGRSSAACQGAVEICTELAQSGPPLSEYLQSLLLHQKFLQESEIRDASLALLRSLIRRGEMPVERAKTLDERVNQEFGADSVRLRSSTNAEDLENFSGAGLYNSYGVKAGEVPSQEIRKVWASVWNFRAFEERDYFNVDHRAVRMGVAVHRSFPDEAVNGVLITKNLADLSLDGYYVNLQKGETSVTNPVSGELPEVFSILPGPSGPQVRRERFSSLSPETPLLSQGEVDEISSITSVIVERFSELYQRFPGAIAFDMEVKWVGEERRLIVKQVRPYSQIGL